MIRPAAGLTVLRVVGEEAVLDGVHVDAHHSGVGELGAQVAAEAAEPRVEGPGDAVVAGRRGSPRGQARRCHCRRLAAAPACWAGTPVAPCCRPPTCARRPRAPSACKSLDRKPGPCRRCAWRRTKEERTTRQRGRRLVPIALPYAWWRDGTVRAFLIRRVTMAGTMLDLHDALRREVGAE